MHRLLASDLAPLIRQDGEWLRCASTGCNAYWGVFRSWTFLRVKVADHRARKHGARVVKPAAGRPQRRAAVAAAPAGHVDVAVAVAAFMAARAGQASELGRGVARIGYPFGPDYVLKIARQGSEDHNLAEFKAYASAPSWAQPYLAPAVAVAPDGKWLLVRKAERVGHASWQDCERVERALRGKVRDLHPGNVGWLDGRWVATDYAGGMHARAPW